MSKKIVHNARKCIMCKNMYIKTNSTQYDSNKYCSVGCKLIKEAVTEMIGVVVNEPRVPTKYQSDELRLYYRKIDRKDRRRENKRKKRSLSSDLFYRSPAWIKIRYQVIKRYGRECGACGSTKGEMHVDHIKPRSKYPELQLDFYNLQVLCKNCNMGKSNKDCTDFRDKEKIPYNSKQVKIDT